MNMSIRFIYSNVLIQNIQDYPFGGFVNLNILIKGEIPTWLYKYLKLPIKLDVYNKITREEDPNSIS